MKGEKKLIRSKFPKDMTAFWENESYLEEQAKKGLFLKEWDGYFILFEEGEPMDMRYRIEIGKTRLSEEEKEMFAQGGWDYVLWYTDFHIFSAPKEREVTEFHTDPMEEAFVMEGYVKKQQRRVLSLGIFHIIIIGTILCLFTFFYQGGFFYRLMTGNGMMIVLLLPIYLQAIPGYWREYKEYRQMRADMHMGVPFRQSVEEKKKKIRKWDLVMLVYCTVVFLLSLSNMTQCQRRDYVGADGVDVTVYGEGDFGSGNRHIVLAKDILDLEGYTFSPEFSQITATKSVFLRDAWESEETWSAEVENLIVENSYYEIRPKALTDVFTKDLCRFMLQAHGQKTSGWEKTERTDERFDRLFVIEDRYKNYIAMKDNRVLLVGCLDIAPETAVLDAMAKALE